MTYVEATFGLTIRDSKPSDTSSREHSDPVDVDAVNSLVWQGKRSSCPRDGCFKRGGAHFQRDCIARKGTGKQSYGKGKQSKSWSKSEPSHSGKGERKENNGKSKGKIQKEPKVRTKVPKAHTRTKHRKLVSQVLKTRNRMQARTFRNLHRHIPRTFPGTVVGTVTYGTMAGVSMNGMMTGVPLDGTKVGNKRMTLPQAHFYLDVRTLVPPVVRIGLNG